MPTYGLEDMPEPQGISSEPREAIVEAAQRIAQEEGFKLSPEDVESLVNTSLDNYRKE